MAEPKPYLLVVQHKRDALRNYAFAESPEAAITACGGPIAAEPGGAQAMTRAEVLDAIEKRLGSRRREGRRANTGL